MTANPLQSLVERLKSEKLTSLTMHPNGRAFAVYRYGCLRFENTEDLARWIQCGQLPDYAALCPDALTKPLPQPLPGLLPV